MKNTYYGEIAPIIFDTPENRELLTELIATLHEIMSYEREKRRRAREDKAFAKNEN